MKTCKTKSTLEIPNIIDEIEVSVEYHIDNDDFGFSYPSIDNIKPVFSNDTAELKEEILKYINDKFDECSAYISEKLELEHEQSEPEFEHEMND